MIKSVVNKEVDFYFRTGKKLHQEIVQLRTIALECGLTEELKWGVPCYMNEKSNIVLIHVFKEYCALLFFKGALINDTNDILIQQTKNVQAARQMRFTNVEEITELRPIIITYIKQALAIEKAGLKVVLKINTTLEFPEELNKKFTEIPALKTAFDLLTPGRQRAYNLYFSAPKQSKTRASRIEKSITQILSGKGLNDL
jgi:uncharacterized protein YdeI (YjbR/CyaY-like superfamily)